MSDETAVVTAEASRPREKKRGPTRRRRRQWFLPTYTGLVIAYLFIPIFVMILFGFNDNEGRFNFVWNRFTLDHWKTLFQFPELRESLTNSIIVAGTATLISAVLGTMIALALTRYRFGGRSAMNLFIFLPMATPEIVIGVSLLAMFVTVNLQRGWLTIIIAHVMFCISYVVVTVKARTSGFDRNLEDAAQDLGASPWVTFWTVTFPLILPGIVAASFLAFLLSFDDFIITELNAGSVITYPRWIFGISRFGIPPEVNVTGTIIFLLGVVYVFVSLWRGRREPSGPPGLPTRA